MQPILKLGLGTRQVVGLYILILVVSSKLKMSQFGSGTRENGGLPREHVELLRVLLSNSIIVCFSLHFLQVSMLGF